MAETQQQDAFDIVVLNFADSRVPEFKEVRNKDWILYGEKNDYPDYLTHLYNKSAKHNAIVNGKCNYILGSGFEKKAPMPGGFIPVVNPDGSVTPAASVNRSGETMLDIWEKSVKDIEIYGGFRWIVIWNTAGEIKEIHHVDFYKIRTAKEIDVVNSEGQLITKDPGGFYYKNNWKDRKEDEIHYPEFDPKVIRGADGRIEPKPAQIFAYNEYRPGCDYYPLPGYIGACNYIDTDIEISKFHLSAIRNGMTPSKMIQFYTGEPTEDKKREIERRFERKFAGSENAGKFILVFNSAKDKTVDIEDLSFSELDKQFDLLNKTCQQEIFTGHQVTSPMLFGIKTEGQLGGNTELKTAYEIFINTYAKPKQANIEKITNYFGGLMGKGSDYYISQLDPVGIILDVKDVIGQLPIEFVFDKLNIPKEYRTASPASTGAPHAMPDGLVNENIKNLTGRQYQQLMRIIRQYTKGQLTKEKAALLLKTGLGLSDDAIETLLKVEDDVDVNQFSAETITEEGVADMFAACGDLKKDFHIVKSKPVKFNTNKEATEDELHFYQQAFKTEVTNTEASIVDLIRKDKRITPEVIAQTIGSTPEYVTAKIASLTKRGIISSTTEIIGDDVQVERTVTQPDIEPPSGEIETTEIFIKYSYEVKPGIGPEIIPTTRPFCRKMIELDRLYSRAEIESISQRLGYSVWDRRGGWWGPNPTCRHRWVSHVVVKKGKK